MKVLIDGKEKGILYKNGKFAAILDAGKYHIFGDNTVEPVSIFQALVPTGCTLDSIMETSAGKEKLTLIEVADNEICMHYLDGNFREVFTAGRYGFWKEGGKHEFRKINIDNPDLTYAFTTAVVQKISDKLYTEINVGPHETARLYFDNKYMGMLEPGKYYFWNGNINVTAEHEDMRTRQLSVTGQEILTADKVALRLNFTMFYKVTDARRVADVAVSLNDYLYSLCQLTLREYVSKYNTDEILENRDKISDEVIAALRDKTARSYIDISSAGIKDIILPGEISDIMNSVLAAEKRAQANVVTRREEVASTRSLLNTAKLMDENATLRKLKELEYIERICEHVSEINVNGGKGLLAELSALLTDSK
ncbi:MAG: slipin family protein [Bacteroides sp.]|nr:slipin family protein [Bacteroides sp.]